MVDAGYDGEAPGVESSHRAFVGFQGGGACELHEDLMGYLSGFIGFFLVGLCKGLVIVVPLSLRDQGERCLWFA